MHCIERIGRVARSKRQRRSAHAKRAPVIGNIIAARELHWHCSPCIPVRFSRLRFGDQHSFDAICLIERCKRLAHVSRAVETDRIQHRQLPFELGFQELARNRKAMFGVRNQRLRAAQPRIVEAADRSRQD